VTPVGTHTPQAAWRLSGRARPRLKPRAQQRPKPPSHPCLHVKLKCKCANLKAPQATKGIELALAVVRPNFAPNQKVPKTEFNFELGFWNFLAALPRGCHCESESVALPSQ
jgi:hypothetical protein